MSSKACTWQNIVELLQDLFYLKSLTLKNLKRNQSELFHSLELYFFRAERIPLYFYSIVYFFFDNVQRLCISVHLREGLRIGKNWLRFHRNLIVLTLEPKMLILIEWNNSFSILTEIDNVTLNNKRLTLSSNEPSTFATFVQEKRSSVTAFSSAADGLIVFRIGRHEL